MSNYQDLCDQFLQIDRSIRYGGIADYLGSLIATAYWPGLVPLSSREETEKYSMQAIQRTGAIHGGPKVGRLQYVIGKYENLVRSTIPLTSDRQDKFYLMLSFDLAQTPSTLLKKKPFLKLKRTGNGSRQCFISAAIGHSQTIVGFGKPAAGHPVDFSAQRK
jgi:hypothetical protein